MFSIDDSLSGGTSKGNVPAEGQGSNVGHLAYLLSGPWVNTLLSTKIP